jgi:thiol-disulfide isomerase/thioredoxin
VTRTAWPAAALVSVLLAAAAAASAADGPQPFYLSGKRVVRVAGAVDDKARVYIAPGTPRAVVLSPVLGAPVYIASTEKKVFALDAARVVPSPDDPDAVLVDADGATGGTPLTVDGLELRFAVGGRPVVLETRPPKVSGDLTAEQLMAAIPEYRRNAKTYLPGKGDMRLLATITEPAEIDVFFGAWCPHCEQHVPRMIKVAEELHSQVLTFRYHGLPEKIADDPLARQYQIQAVPVALVRRGDKVVARIEGPSWARPEAALSAVLVGEAALAPAGGGS